MNTITKLYKNQVHDPQRGSFLVGLTAAKDNKRYMGLPVYVDSYGRSYVILDA